LTFNLFRLLVAVVLLAVLFWRSDPAEVWRVGTNAKAGPLLMALALVFVDRALMAWRWFELLRPIEPGRLPSFGKILQIFFVSTFVGTFLPGSIGGDAVRAYSLSRHGVTPGDSLVSVMLDRMLGVLSLLLMALASLLLARDLAANAGLVLALIFTAAVCALAAGLVFSSRMETLAVGLLARLRWAKARQLGDAAVGATRRYSRYRASLMLVLVGSLGVQVLRITQAWYLGLALGVTQPLTVYFAFVPLVLLIMLLPITINGIGTSQAAFVWLFGLAGTPDAQAFALSVLFVALGVVGNLPGAVLYAMQGTQRQAAYRTGSNAR
jgi:glycosyltransferase 2 family protein